MLWWWKLHCKSHVGAFKKPQEGVQAILQWIMATLNGLLLEPAAVLSMVKYAGGNLDEQLILHGHPDGFAEASVGQLKGIVSTLSCFCSLEVVVLFEECCVLVRL